MRFVRPLLVIAAALAPVAAQAMTVQEWLSKGDALRAQGVLALGSPDIKLLTDEVKAASDVYRAKLAADLTAGRKPTSCPPPRGQAKVTGEDLTTAFRALPPAQRRQSVKDAFIAYMTKRYPCK